MHGSIVFPTTQYTLVQKNEGLQIENLGSYNCPRIQIKTLFFHVRSNPLGKGISILRSNPGMSTFRVAGWSATLDHLSQQSPICIQPHYKYSFICLYFVTVCILLLGKFSNQFHDISLDHIAVLTKHGQTISISYMLNTVQTNCQILCIFNNAVIRSERIIFLSVWHNTWVGISLISFSICFDLTTLWLNLNHKLDKTHPLLSKTRSHFNFP